MSERTDRELLELAAKAAGVIDDATDQSEAYGLHRGEDRVFYTTDSDGWREWSPLTDDGDALRLAAHIGMIVDVRYGERMKEMQCHNRITYWVTPSNGMTVDCDNPGSNNMASIRRAIVRAAAEIGANMQS